MSMMIPRRKKRSKIALWGGYLLNVFAALSILAYAFGWSYIGVMLGEALKKFLAQP